MPLLSPTLARPARAAARLAALYAAGVTALVVALGLAVAGVDDVLRDVAALAWPAGLCFGLAFVLLAVARRAGFSALWVTVLALWGWMALRYQPHGPRPGPDFAAWSLFAAPLYGIVRLGFRRRAPRSAWRRGAAAALAVGWAALAIAGVRFEYWPAEFFALGRADLALVRTLLSAAWRIAPGAITALAIWLVHRPDALESPAA